MRTFGDAVLGSDAVVADPRAEELRAFTRR
jgi:hypothetical protein